MKYNYLVVSDSYVLVKEKINSIIKNTKFTNEEISTYDLDSVDVDLVVEDLDTYSLLSNKKVIIIKNIFSNPTDKKLGRLLKYINNFNPDNLLIMTSEKLDNRLSIVKEFKKNSNLEFINLEQDPINYTKNLLKDYKVDFNGIRNIVSLCKEDINRINSECEKLMLYKIDDKVITNEDIESLVVKKLGDSSELLFSLIKHIIMKDKKEAFKTYIELKEYNIDSNSIIGLMASQMRLIEQIKLLSDDNLNNNEIMSTLKLKSLYQIKKIKEYIYMYSYHDIHELLNKLFMVDYSIKSGKITTDNAIDMLIINL